MRKEVITVLLVILALALAGCQSNGKTPGSDSSTPFIGGTTGLTAKFATNSPPAEVTDRDVTTGAPTNTFDVIVLLENIGESKVAQRAATVSISGISASDFGTSSLKKQNTDELTGVKKDTEGNKIPGSVADVRFENLAFQTQLQGNAVFPVQADVCYPYGTNAVTDLCVRSDATKATSGVCQITGQKTVFNSGAPIQVSSVKENVGGRNKVLLTFNVKTVGTGSFYKPASGCPKGTFSAENVVRADVSGIPGQTLTCSGLSGGAATSTGSAPGYGGFLRIDNGAGTFSCIQTTPPEDSIKKVNIKLSYDHLISASTSLLVKHLPTDTGSPSGSAGYVPGAPTISFSGAPTSVVQGQQFDLTVTAYSTTTSPVTSINLQESTPWQYTQTSTTCNGQATTCQSIFRVTVTNANSNSFTAYATAGGLTSPAYLTVINTGSGGTGTPPAPAAPAAPGTSGGLQLSAAGIAWVSQSDASGVTALKTLCSKVVGGVVEENVEYTGNPPYIARCYCPNNNKIPSLTITSFTC